eukprot:9060089-Alexandrium_andersonii.AAC.1
MWARRSACATDVGVSWTMTVRCDGIVVCAVACLGLGHAAHAEPHVCHASTPVRATFVWKGCK